MFWGLIMEPNKRYTQTVDKSFHLSMASLDAATADKEIVQVTLRYGEQNYLLCTLKRDTTWQVPLDLNFQEGTQIAFTCNGRGHVHLTGYLIPEDDDMDLEELDEEAEEEDEEIPQLVATQTKRKASESPNNKKSKRMKALLDAIDNETSDEDSSDPSGELAGDGEEVEEEDSDDEEAEGEEEADDDDEEDDDDEDQEEESKVQLEQKKKESKKDKKKLANGNEVKPEAKSQKDKKNKGEQQKNGQPAQLKRTISGGVVIEDIKAGNGPVAKPGKFVSVHYIGRLKNGKKFDSTMQGEGFKFRLGKGEVIKGWDVGITGMKVGGKRRISIPPPMGYGAKGSPPTIPGNSTLVFDVELKNVH